LGVVTSKTNNGFLYLIAHTLNMSKRLVACASRSSVQPRGCHLC